MTVVRARGGSLDELAFAQGRATAEASRDRLLEDLAHVESATGTPWDDFASRSLLARTARRAHDRLLDDARSLVDAYAAGVRAGGVEEWRDWTSLGVMAVHHALFGTLGHHLWRRHVVRQLGRDAAARLVQEAPALSGSNAWVVGGSRSADGLPLVGADPHRLVTVPGVYQRVHLVADDEDVDVVGLAFPGVPGVQHFGHTGTVAWAITNAMADTQHLTDVAADDPRELVDGVPVTDHGPLVLERPDGSGVAVRTVPWLLDDLGLDALPLLLRARSVADVDAALDAWIEPVNDVLVADAEGRVLHRVAGRVPRRSAPDESAAPSGWVEPFRREVGADGHLVTANHRQGPHSAELADELAPPHRAHRLEQLIEEHDVLDVDTAATLHADTLLLPAVHWQQRLRDLDLDAEVEQVGVLRDRIVSWDRHMDADSVEAALFATLRSAVVRRLVAHPALAPLADPSVDPSTGPGELFAPWLRPEPRVALALDRWLAPGGEPVDGIDLDHELHEALRASAPTLSAPAAWGDVHTFTPLGGPAVRLSGDDGCVLSTSSLPGVDDRVWRGPVARLVWCLADRSRSRWTVPDEIDVWAAGGTSPLTDERETREC